METTCLQMQVVSHKYRNTKHSTMTPGIKCFRGFRAINLNLKQWMKPDTFSIVLVGQSIYWWESAVLSYPSSEESTGFKDTRRRLNVLERLEQTYAIQVALSTENMAWISHKNAFGIKKCFSDYTVSTICHMTRLAFIEFHPGPHILLVPSSHFYQMIITTIA